ncbi:hypothetical protein D9757_002448 [Collybiopsis confluens]|uniref:Uncharacterized protein n=1 Tax=Collybiopsis confluens TaxID=2823264 RepID=A0A8H5MF24_9AGAR|nr:hypothetical protein D9757_002448 [Collybiopsis confluens]
MSSIYYLYHTVLSVPFTGVLVRYRASYNPKELEAKQFLSSREQGESAIHLPVQEQKDTPPEQVVSVSEKDASAGAADTLQSIRPNREPFEPSDQNVTFLSVLKRTYTIQGFDGLSKGLLPTLIFTFVWPSLLGYLGPSPPTFMLSLKQSFVFSIFYIPVLTTIYRTITTSHKIGAYRRPHLEEHIRHLFSQYERSRCWAIYLTPGLIPAMTLVVVVSTACLLLLNRLIWASYKVPGSFNGFLSELLLRISGSILLCFLGTIILAPLEVVITRLLIQRNHAAPEIPGLSLIMNLRRSRQAQEESVEDQHVDVDLERGGGPVSASTYLPDDDDDVVVQ